MVLPANALTISVSGTITVASGGSLYSVGQPVTIVFTTVPSLGLPNGYNDSSLSSWAGGWAADPDPGIPVWSNITVSGTTGIWNDALLQTESQSNLFVNRAINMVGLNSGNVNPTVGLNLFTAGIELGSFGGELSFLPGALPAWPGFASGTAENVLPASGTYLTTPLVDFNLFFRDGSVYTLGDNVSGLSVTIDSIPEPTVSGLAIIGLAVAGFRRRR